MLRGRTASDAVSRRRLLVPSLAEVSETPLTREDSGGDGWFRSLPGPVRLAAAAATVLVSYYISARLGLALAAQPANAAPLWPPNAILLTALLLSRPRSWWIFLAAVVPAELAADLGAGLPIRAALTFLAADWVEVLVAAGLLLRFGRRPLRFERVRETAVFLVCAVLAAPALAAFPGALASIAGGAAPDFWPAWRQWFLSDALTHLALTPFLVLWCQWRPGVARVRSRPGPAEAALLFVMLTGAGVLAFAGPIDGPFLPAYLVLPFPLLLWVAIRFGPRGASSAIMVVTVMAIIGGVRGRGPFTLIGGPDDVLGLQTFLFLAIAPLIVTSTLVEERRLAEGALQRSQARLRDLFEDSPASILEGDLSVARHSIRVLRAAGVVDVERYLTQNPDALDRIVGSVRVLRVNRAAAELFGAPASSTLADNVTRVFAPETRPVSAALLAALASGQTHFEGETLFRTLDGSSFWAAVAVAVAPGHEAEWDRVLVSVLDITDRKRAEQELAESQERYRRVVEDLEEFIVRWLPDGTRIFVNTAYCRYFQRSRDELVGSSRLAEIVAADRSEVLDRIAGFTVDAPSGAGQHRVQRPDGSVGWQEWTDRAVFDRDGVLIEIQSIGRDITERKHAEERLTLLSAALSATANAVVITDANGVITWVNPSFTTLTGFEFDEAVGRTTRILKSGMVDPSTYRDLWSTITAGQVWRGELVNRRRDGSLYTEVSTITPVTDASGVISHFVSIKLDVTRQREMEEQVRQSQKLEAVGRLASGVAHDFSNLLQAMLGTVSPFAASTDDRLAAVGRELERQILSGSQLTRDLLLFSSREASDRTIVDLDQVTRRTAGLLARLLPENIDVVTETAPGRPLVSADEGQLEQVLMNLGVNAADAMPEGGRLLVRSGAGPAATAWFEVEDSGHGIPPEIRERIFEPFFTTKESGRGAGLGLSVAQGIVAAHDGRIELATVVDGGSLFRVVLPAVAATDLEPPSYDRDDNSPRGHGERILVVEDDTAVRAVVDGILSDLGYSVRAVATVGDALRTPTEPRYDLLLCDCLLPDGRGPDLADTLCRRWPRLRVVLMSGYAEESVTGGDRRRRFLQKPFLGAALGREIHAALAEAAPADGDPGSPGD